MTDKLDTGGCLCGAVRYEARPVENSAYYCHCRDCQLGSSSAFTVAVFSRESEFRLTAGVLSTYSKSADSGRRIDRLFCANCGTPIAWQGEGFPGFTLISLSSLDEPEKYPPVHEAWTAGAVSWCRVAEAVESFPGRPQRDFLSIE